MLPLLSAPIALIRSSQKAWIFASSPLAYITFAIKDAGAYVGYWVGVGNAVDSAFHAA
jgi:ABC-type amino acid transport substrate-binding protein